MVDLVCVAFRELVLGLILLKVYVFRFRSTILEEMRKVEAEFKGGSHLSPLSPTHGRPGPRLGSQSLPGATILFSAIRLLSVFIKDIGVQ